MNVKKAGCILLDLKNKRVGLVYRPKRKDYSFPKGHLEEGETFEECAIRETEEETGRVCKIINANSPLILKYTDSLGHKSIVYYFIAIDQELSTKTFNPNDIEELIWTPFESVENILSYKNLKNLWNEIKDKVMEMLSK